MTGRIQKVQVKDGRVTVSIDDEAMNLTTEPLSEILLEWFIHGRRAGYDSLVRGEGPGPLFSRHLPVVLTMGEDGPFPGRMAHKGVGLLPQPDILSEYISRYEELLEQTKDMSPERSLIQRLQGAARILDEPAAIDPRLLGSLEIFSGGTYTNLTRRPLASLLFTDPGSGYRSFQLDCVVEIVEPPDLRFRYLQLARALFEKDPFHIPQPGVHCAYLFWIVGIHDKTPHPVEEGKARHKF